MSNKASLSNFSQNNTITARPIRAEEKKNPLTAPYFPLFLTEEEQKGGQPTQERSLIPYGSCVDDIVDMPRNSIKELIKIRSKTIAYISENLPIEMRVFAVEFGKNNLLDAIKISLEINNKDSLIPCDDFLTEEGLAEFSNRFEINIYIFSSNKEEKSFSLIGKYRAVNSCNGNVYLLKINGLSKSYPVHFDVMVQLPKFDLPGGLGKFSVTTGHPLGQKKLEPSEHKAVLKLHDQLIEVYKDIKNQTELLLEVVSFKDQKGKASEMRWRIDIIRFLKARKDLGLNNISDAQLDRLLKLELTKGIPSCIALEGNNSYPWISDGNGERLSLPIIICNYLNIKPYDKVKKVDKDFLKLKYAIGLAYMDGLESPDLYLKNLASALQRKTQEEGLAGASLVIYGLPPKSFLNWLRYYGAGSELNQLEKESPIPNVEILMAVKIPHIPQGKQFLGNLVFGHFLFTLKTSQSKFYLKNNNTLSSGFDRNYGTHWEKIRPFTKIDELINKAYKAENQIQRFFELICFQEIPDRQEIPWGELEDKGDLRRYSLAITGIHVKKLIDDMDNSSSKKEQCAARKKLEKNGITTEKSALKSLGKKVFSYLRRVQENIKNKNIKNDMYNLNPSHLIDDVMKGLDYSKCFLKISEISAVKLDEFVHYEVHAIQSRFLMQIHHDYYLHLVKFPAIFEEYIEPTLEFKIIHLLTSITALIGRSNSKMIVVENLARQLAAKMVQVGLVSVAYKWENCKWKETAFGDDTHIETGKYFNMDIIEIFKNIFIENVKEFRKKNANASNFLSPEEIYNEILTVVLLDNKSYEKLDENKGVVTIQEFINFLKNYANPTDRDVRIMNLTKKEQVCVEFIRNGSDKPLSSLHFFYVDEFRVEGVAKYIYVILPNNKVLISPESIFNEEQRSAHSQLAKGGAVKAAGELIFRKIEDQWTLCEINNGSGHYRPPAHASLPAARDLIIKKLKGTGIVAKPETIRLHNCLLTDLPGGGS